ncbi:MAG: nucleoside hydrolase [Ardenticatenaceae bacterium]
MERMIIDTDPGVDDAQAIMMAFAYPGVKVEAIMTVGGNVGLDRTTANACTILDLLGEDVPIYAGCDSPLVLFSEDAAFVHGDDGLGDVGFGVSERQIEPEHAAVALVRLANESPGEITLVTIGPLTNVAVALKLDPHLPQKFKRLLVMGGAIRSRGNTSNLSAEFNVFADPEAAHVVFEAWPEFDLVDWETTMAHGFPPDLLQKWSNINTTNAKFFTAITAKVRKYLKNVLGRTTLYSADPLAMAVALEPSIVQKAEKHHITVELTGRHTRGQTTVDWGDRSGRKANANIVLQVDIQRYFELMENAL